jgi:hypothetical protein
MLVPSDVEILSEEPTRRERRWLGRHSGVTQLTRRALLYWTA